MREVKEIYFLLFIPWVGNCFISISTHLFHSSIISRHSVSIPVVHLQHEYCERLGVRREKGIGVVWYNYFPMQDLQGLERRRR